MAVDKLNEATTLARGDLDVGDLAESLEEGSELVLGDIAGQSTDEDGGVVGVGELVHLRSRVVAAIRREALHATPHGLLRNTAHHGTTAVLVAARTSESVVTAREIVSQKENMTLGRIQHGGLPVLGGSGRDSHRSVTAVNALHFDQGTLLIILIGEADEAVTSALARHGIRHDLGRLARGEASLEKRDQDVFINLRAEIANEDAILGATVIAVWGTLYQHEVTRLEPAKGCRIMKNNSPSVDKAAARSPVKLELTRAVRDRGPIKPKCLSSRIRGSKLDKAVAGIAV